jgi:hypothetical protein
MVEWYFKTAGAEPEDGYRWLSWETRHVTVRADRLLKETRVAETTLQDLTLPSTPSIVLARFPDGRFAFYANEVLPQGAPEQGAPKGDYMGRPIAVNVLGVAPADADPDCLLDAAVAAFRQQLARQLPLSWTAAGSPQLAAPRPDRWPEGIAVQAEAADFNWISFRPQTDSARTDVAAQLAALSLTDLRKFPKDRILALESEALDLAGLERLQPWRAVTSQVDPVKEKVTRPWRPKSGGYPVLAVACGIVLLIVVAVLVLVFFA